MAVDTNGYISRGNMTIVMSAAGLIMLAFGGFITSQNNAIDTRIRELKDELRGALRKEEHEEFKLRIDKDIKRIDERRLDDNLRVVPRTEHEARWKATDEKMQILADNLRLISERLNELRTSTNGTVTTRDEIARLHTELSELRRLLNERAPIK